MSNFVVIHYIIFVCVLKNAFSQSFPDADLRGDYCGALPQHQRCCQNRLDNCSTPILGTLCYCDEFCRTSPKRNYPPDCCPDYGLVCLNETPRTPPEQQCYFNQRYYKQDEKFKINCNQCVCQNMKTKMEILCSTHECLMDYKIVDLINRNNDKYGWIAANYSRFWGKTMDHGFKYYLGTINSRKKVLDMRPKSVDRSNTLPRSFDVREKWPGLIVEPRDQGECGSSWVFSTVSVASDRLNIMSQGAHQGHLSYQQLLSCNRGRQNGCEGGQLTRAWQWINRHGLVNDDCQPYIGVRARCEITRNRTWADAPCPSRPYELTRLHRTSPVYRIKGESSIMKEIMDHGPVQSLIEVDRTFFTYLSGVFKCLGTAQSKSWKKGVHSVKLVGWGETGDQKYWIAANSWGPNWGENGYFRISRHPLHNCQVGNLVLAALGSWTTAST